MTPLEEPTLEAVPVRAAATQFADEIEVDDTEMGARAETSDEAEVGQALLALSSLFLLT